MGKIAYLGLDVHARQSVLGHMDESGTLSSALKLPHLAPLTRLGSSWLVICRSGHSVYPFYFRQNLSPLML
jgi:hypothetical protein